MSKDKEYRVGYQVWPNDVGRDPYEREHSKSHASVDEARTAAEKHAKSKIGWKENKNLHEKNVKLYGEHPKNNTRTYFIKEHENPYWDKK